jgi:hypothetical protein
VVVSMRKINNRSNSETPGVVHCVLYGIVECRVLESVSVCVSVCMCV